MSTALEKIEIKPGKKSLPTFNDIIIPILRKNRFFMQCARIKKPYSTEKIIKLLDTHLSTILKECPQIPESNYIFVMASVINYLIKANCRNPESLLYIKLSLADLFKQAENKLKDEWKDKKEEPGEPQKAELFDFFSTYTEIIGGAIDRLRESKTILNIPRSIQSFQQSLVNSSLIKDHAKPAPEELVAFFITCLEQYNNPQDFPTLVNLNQLLEEHREIIEKDEKATTKLKAVQDSILISMLAGSGDTIRGDISFVRPVCAKIIEKLHKIAYSEQEPFPSLAKIPDTVKKEKLYEALVLVIPNLEDKEALTELKHYLTCEINIVTELLNMPTGILAFTHSTTPTTEYCKILDLLDRREKELADDLYEDPTSKVICGLWRIS